MSRIKDLAISLALAITVVTIFTGASIPIILATQYWMDDDDIKNIPYIMLVQAYVGCFYDENGFITNTVDHLGSVTVAWPHVKVAEDGPNGYNSTHLCSTEQYGKAWQWPFGPYYERTAYAEITV